MESRLKAVINDNEKIVWNGKPDKRCFILESIFNPLLPFALLWAVIDTFVFFVAFREVGFMIVAFLLLHMMPVWIYIAGVIFSAIRYSRIEYYITDAGVYISGGLFSYSYDFKPFAVLTNVSLHRGIIDQMCGCGDVVFNVSTTVSDTSNGSNVKKFAIINIHNYEEIYKLVNQMQRDIHADTMYPNDLRPTTNHGYKTSYTPEDNNQK